MVAEFLELHDTSVDAIRSDGDIVVLEMRAYIHRPGLEGSMGGTGWVQRGDLVISGSRIGEQPDGGKLDIWRGSIRVGNASFDDVVRLPLDRTGEVLLRFHGAEGTLEIAGAAVRWTPRGEAVFVEETEFTVDEFA